MNPVKIFTDSTASLSKELIDRFNLSIVPLYVLFDDESYKDGIEIGEDKLYKIIKEKGKLPTTSAPTPTDFINAFKPWIEDGYDIVYIGISSELSCAVQNARIAASEFDDGRVYVVDSLNLSSGIGLVTLEAAEYAMAGFDAKTVYEKTLNVVPRVRSSFVIDTLNHLHMGGRCSSLAKWIGSVFKIHPRIVVEDGKMTVGEKFKGKRKTVLNGLLRSAIIKKDKIDPHRVFITHSYTSEKDLEYLKEELSKALNIDEILITDAGCVIATHCGKKTVGILYIEKD